MNIINFSYRFAARDPLFDVYPGKPRREGGLPWEGYEKARWLHHVSGVPVTWIVDSVAIDQAYRRMRNDVETTGDELILQLEPFAHQPLLEKLGIKQEPFGLRNYKTGDLVTLFKGLKKFAEDKLELPVTIGSGYWLSAHVIRAAAEAGFEAIWGMCWDQKGIDGATHRGSPWFPYYLSEEDFKAPSTKPGGVLFFPWYRADLGNAFLLNHHPPFTTHSGELVRWNLDFPETYVRAMFAQAAHEARTSPFAFSQVHLECDWMDSSGIFHDEDTSPAAVTFEFQKKMFQRKATNSAPWRASSPGIERISSSPPATTRSGPIPSRISPRCASPPIATASAYRRSTASFSPRKTIATASSPRPTPASSTAMRLAAAFVRTRACLSPSNGACASGPRYPTARRKAPASTPARQPRWAPGR